MFAAVSAEKGRVGAVGALEVLRAFLRVGAFDVVAQSAVVFVFRVAKLANFLLSRVTTLPMRLHHHPGFVLFATVVARKVLYVRVADHMALHLHLDGRTEIVAEFASVQFHARTKDLVTGVHMSMVEIAQAGLKIALIALEGLVLPVDAAQVSEESGFGRHLALADVAFDRHLVRRVVVLHQHVVVKSDLRREGLITGLTTELAAVQLVLEPLVIVDVAFEH